MLHVTYLLLTILFSFPDTRVYQGIDEDVLRTIVAQQKEKFEKIKRGEKIPVRFNAYVTN
jgi:hypothetical protein